jgi:ketosteroid isomerase-like protein
MARRTRDGDRASRSVADAIAGSRGTPEAEAIAGVTYAPDQAHNSDMPIDAAGFASCWEAAGNAHDLDELLGHFSDDVVFTSPVAAQLIEGSGGVIHGKAALRDYWTLGLELIPDLRFTVEGVYAGLDVVVINYRNQRGNLVSEVLRFGEAVVEGHGTYLIDALADPGSAAGVTAS